ncbi:MAG: peptidase domain-containing ABC transporter [Bacteroidales bacterium]|nr:peptidase domain-containing ABC transporter [Bacteroidales bacterium]MDY5192964.1 peptidase domain-containing ABC transporter [Candidatus Aphodosoma sp.]
MKRKFPVNIQLDSIDCGPTCLKSIAEYYGKFWSLNTLRQRCYIGNNGVSLLGISEAAESIGLRTAGVKLTYQQLRDEAVFPCIVHWNQEHFVVVYDIKRKKNNDIIRVFDPAVGLLDYNKDKFIRFWKQSNDFGIALLLETTPDFYKNPDEKDKGLSFKYLLEYLSPYSKYIAQVVIAMIVGSLISLIFPFITQNIVDKGIGTGNISLIVTLLIAQVVLIFGQTANNLIRSWLMLHITSRISISLISDFLAKLMRLPISFFDTKKVGDILQRINDYSRIQNFLTGSLLSIAIAIVTFAVYSVLMSCYNLAIFGVFIVGSVLYILWITLFLRQRRKLDYMRFQESAVNQNSLVQLVSGMQEIKLNNFEKQKKWEWQRIQAKLFKISVKSMSLSQTQEVGALFIDQGKNVIISFMAALSVINGEISLGIMMSLQYIIGQLNSPISQFISFLQATQDAKISLERMSEIQSKDDEDKDTDNLIIDIPANSEIILNNVTFQYEGPHSPKVLNNINLVIPNKKITAIVGYSGSGKSTLLKMLLGFYPPVSGEILLNDISLDKYKKSIWRSKCGIVMQDGYIFSDTIINNIAAGDENPDIDRIAWAAKMSNIDSWISSLPLGYKTKIGGDGLGISVGQRQRILIARAVYKKADYLFLDEATNSLDAENEAVIMDNLAKIFSGKTVVVIAHRLSTVKNADQIVVLDNGNIVEIGSHLDLINKKGLYFSLVKNQLDLGS